MPKGYEGAQAEAPSTTDEGRIADLLAEATQGSADPSGVVVDTTLAPHDGPLAVTLPDCRGCVLEPRRRHAGPQSTDPRLFEDLIADECRGGLHPILTPVAQLRFARAYIDQVKEGVVEYMPPSFEDLARIACPYQRAEVMVLLQVGGDGCACAQALIASLPSDSIPGAFAKASWQAATPAELLDRETASHRRRQRSSEWSRYLLAKQAERRRPPTVSLFDEQLSSAAGHDPS